jgi:hypothetical protein
MYGVQLMLYNVQVENIENTLINGTIKGAADT